MQNMLTDVLLNIWTSTLTLASSEADEITKSILCSSEEQREGKTRKMDQTEPLWKMSQSFNRA